MQVSKIHFLFEQDGNIERNLKSKLKEYFLTNKCIEKAYLAMVSYDKQKLGNVALCLLCGKCEDDKIVENVQNIFQKLFGVHENFDIIFIDRKKEKELISVCNSFYNT